MKLNEHERSRPNIAGLTSPVQQAELKLLLAGRWPPLKPLPVFKYETDEYRASIDFDKTRGEWVCRKTYLPSNKVQELRGGLREITMALPHGHVEVFAECATAEQQEQESENEAKRPLQAILEWRENYGNGALYSELQDYLSESQQDEIYDSIRMTLTLCVTYTAISALVPMRTSALTSSISWYEACSTVGKMVKKSLKNMQQS
jgi:hypothetical protein